MHYFSIKQVSHFTGTQAHTLRTWESRGFIAPAARRDNNNIRSYNLDQLELLMNVSLLVHNGYRISSLMMANAEQLRQKVHSLRDEQALRQHIIHDLIISMYKLDGDAFDHAVKKAVAAWGEEKVLTEIVFKFLDITGLLWKGNRKLEEHFVVTLLRSKIILAIEGLRANEKNAKAVLLFLPEKGQLDLLLLYTHYLLKRKGLHILYLGSDISIENLSEAIVLKRPSFILTAFPEKQSMNFEQLSGILALHPETKLISIKKNSTKSFHSNLANIFFLNYKDAVESITENI